MYINIQQKLIFGFAFFKIVRIKLDFKNISQIALFQIRKQYDHI